MNPVRFCTDCLTPNGRGGWVGYNRIQGWRLLGSELGLTGDALTYFRYCCASGLSIKGTHDYAIFDDNHQMDYANFGQNVATQGAGASLNAFTTQAHLTARWRAAQAAMATGTTATGAARRSTQNLFRAAELDNGGFYAATEVCFSALSTSAEEFHFRFGFDDGSANTFGNAATAMIFAYDRGNALGNNASNADRWQAWNRSSSTSSPATNSTLAPSISRDAYDRLEVYCPPSSDRVEYYLNEVLLKYETTQISSGSYLRGQATILKSVGTTDRQAIIDWTYFHTRRPEGIASHATVTL